LRLTTALYYTPDGRSIQGKGITPNIVVKAPKDQQVAGVLMPRESTLQHAFHNPGPLSKKGHKGNNKTAAAAAGKAVESPPIKSQLIGTDKDAQLKAAISYIGSQGPTRTTGRG
jgi:carboxyl-terminal processing protease